MYGVDRLALALVLAAAPSATAIANLTSDQARILESARTSALAYSERLPNFICTQVTNREETHFGGATDFGGPDLGKRVSNDLIEERLTYFGQKEHYQLVSINGNKAAGEHRDDFGGVVSGGEFGSALREIFAPESQTVFTWVKTTKVNGREAYVFGFRVPQANGAKVTHRATNQEIIAAFGGEIAVDQETLNVLRISSAMELPTTFPIVASELAITYQPVKIAEKVYVLPVHSEVRVKDMKHLYVNRIEFKNYQKFTTNLTIQY